MDFKLTEKGKIANKLNVLDFKSERRFDIREEYLIGVRKSILNKVACFYYFNMSNNENYDTFSPIIILNNKYYFTYNTIKLPRFIFKPTSLNLDDGDIYDENIDERAYNIINKIEIFSNDILMKLFKRGFIDINNISYMEIDKYDK